MIMKSFWQTRKVKCYLIDTSNLVFISSRKVSRLLGKLVKWSRKRGSIRSYLWRFLTFPTLYLKKILRKSRKKQTSIVLHVLLTLCTGSWEKGKNIWKYGGLVWWPEFEHIFVIIYGLWKYFSKSNFALKLWASCFEYNEYDKPNKNFFEL